MGCCFFLGLLRTVEIALNPVRRLEGRADDDDPAAPVPVATALGGKPRAERLRVDNWADARLPNCDDPPAPPAPVGIDEEVTDSVVSDRAGDVGLLGDCGPLVSMLPLMAVAISVSVGASPDGE